MIMSLSCYHIHKYQCNHASQQEDCSCTHQSKPFQLESHLQVHSLQQQLQDLQQAADSSETAQQQLADQLREVSHDKSLLEQQLEAFMLEQASGSILAPSS